MMEGGTLTKMRDSVSGWMPEFMFLIFKVAESILEPACRIFIYESVCVNLYGDGGVCNPTDSLLESHSNQEINVQQQAARYILYYKMLVNLPAMIVVLFCGVWSDSSGRKMPILLTCMGTATASLIYMLSIYMEPNQPPFLPIILLGAGVRGAFGRSAIMTMSVNSYVADGSSKEKRTQRLSNLVAMSHFGYLLGSSAAGILLDKFGFTLVFILVMILEMVCILATVVCLRKSGVNIDTSYVALNDDDVKSEGKRMGTPMSDESRDEFADSPRTHRISFNDVVDDPPLRFKQRNLISDIHSTKRTRTMSVLSPITDHSAKRYRTFSTIEQSSSLDSSMEQSHNEIYAKNSAEMSVELSGEKAARRNWYSDMFSSLQVLRRKRAGRDRCNLWILFVIIGIHQMNKSGETDILLLFVKRSPLSFTRSQYGYLLSANYAFLGLFAFFLPKFLSATGMKVKDSSLAIIGTCFKIIHLVAIAFSSSMCSIFVVSAFVGPHSLSVSTVKSMVSKLSEENEMGKTFSLVSSWETMSNLLGSVIYTTSYSLTAHVHPGITFIIEAALYVFNVSLLIELACSASSNGSCIKACSASSSGSCIKACSASSSGSCMMTPNKRVNEVESEVESTGKNACS